MAKEGLDFSQYEKNYTEAGLMEKISAFAKKAGVKVIYLALTLYYTLSSEAVSLKDKGIIVGALGYFILPTDLIPDFIAVVGFTDDLAALYAAYKVLSKAISPEIKQQAMKKLSEWFPDYTRDEIKLEDESLGVDEQ